MELSDTAVVCPNRIGATVQIRKARRPVYAIGNQTLADGVGSPVWSIPSADLRHIVCGLGPVQERIEPADSTGTTPDGSHSRGDDSCTGVQTIRTGRGHSRYCDDRSKSY
jgi:hypothetical protein